MTMKTKRMALTACMAMVFANGARGQDQFIPGNIFVAGVISEGCSFDGDSIIVELDPITGPVNLLATSQNGLCDVSGLRFTPQGDRLPALNVGRSRPPFDLRSILSIAPRVIGHSCGPVKGTLARTLCTLSQQRKLVIIRRLDRLYAAFRQIQWAGGEIEWFIVSQGCWQRLR